MPRKGTKKEATFKLCPKIISGEVTRAQAARSIGVSTSTVREYLSQYRAQEGLPVTYPSLPPELEPTDRELLETTDSHEDIATLWGALEKRSEKAIEELKEARVWRFKTKEYKPIGLVFASDQHITALYAHHERMRKDAEVCRDTPGMMAWLAGDGVDNHIKHRSGIIHASVEPDTQFKLYNHYLGFFGDSLLGGITGNHDHWSYQMAGIDMVGELFKQRKLVYNKHEIVLEIECGDQVYQILVRHSARGSSIYHNNHAHARERRFGSGEYDAIVLGHTHEVCCKPDHYKGRKVYDIRPGSYQVGSDCSFQWGFPDATPYCPTLILYPDKKDMIGDEDIHRAARILEIERKAYE